MRACVCVWVVCARACLRAVNFSIIDTSVKKTKNKKKQNTKLFRSSTEMTIRQIFCRASAAAGMGLSHGLFATKYMGQLLSIIHLPQVAGGGVSSTFPGPRPQLGLRAWGCRGHCRRCHGHPSSSPSSPGLTPCTREQRTLLCKLVHQRTENVAV